MSASKIKKSGAFIYKLRKELGLTQSEFAKKLKIKQSNISNLENDKYDISLSKFVNICKLFNYTNYNKLLK